MHLLGYVQCMSFSVPFHDLLVHCLIDVDIDVLMYCFNAFCPTSSDALCPPMKLAKLSTLLLTSRLT